MTIHGASNNNELGYATWAGMKARCSNPNNKDYIYYGARGIKVCERWQEFASFLEDMGPKPTAQHSIERRDNDKDYEPENCYWATAIEQIHNRRPLGSAIDYMKLAAQD